MQKKIILGVCGGVASYKSAYLVRELTSLGALVQVVMTDSAKQFVSPLLFQALSGHAVRDSLFDKEAERAMGHIELARWADTLVIAPASANFLAKMAHGIADCLLSTLYLVAEVPVIVCPAMNKSMWAHPATLANCEVLKQRNVRIRGPEEGSQACGEYGFGRMSDVEDILTALRLSSLKPLLAGKKVVISAGPTREAIDPVRFLSNYSSGKMGYALAEAALVAGAQVVLVSGPSVLKASAGIKRILVESAQAMKEAVLDSLELGVIYIGAAAVADYKIQDLAVDKIKKKDKAEFNLKLVKNVDILEAVVASQKASYVLGFALETNHVLAFAREKLQQKQLDMIVANQVGKGVGFDSDCNQVTIITKTEQIALPFMHKTNLAGEIIAILATNLHNESP